MGLVQLSGGRRRGKVGAGTEVRPGVAVQLGLDAKTSQSPLAAKVRPAHGADELFEAPCPDGSGCPRCQPPLAVGVCASSTSLSR